MLDRYQLHAAIGSGATATVHLARLRGGAGFSRIVCVKRLHAELARDPKFARRLLEEARTAALVRHPNVIATLDVEHSGSELWLVMEYVHGVTLRELLRGGRIPPPIASALLVDVLAGLGATHSARKGKRRLNLVHRDVSPGNILVGADGAARLGDFGVARAMGAIGDTRTGQYKGTLAYAAPEQMRRRELDGRADLHAAAAVLWEALSGRPLVSGDSEAELVRQIIDVEFECPAYPNLPSAAQAVLKRALAKDPERRFADARQMARALADALPPAPQLEVAHWVLSRAQPSLDALTQQVARIEANTTASPPEPSPRAQRRVRRWAAWFCTALAVVSVVFTAVGGVWLEHQLAPAPALSAFTEPEFPLPAPTETEAAASAAPQPARRPNAPRRPATNCDPPFRIDANGIKRFKLECVR